MKFISVCAGIDAASVAWAPLGWKAVGFSEIEPFPCSVLAHRFPYVPNFGDMKKFREWPEAAFVDADIIVGGPPCQAFSLAGARNGLADSRGNLTLTYAQLIDHADAIRIRHGKPPVIAVFENVPGILSDKTNAFGCLMGILSGENDALVPPGRGWTNAGLVHGPARAISWRLLDAQYFGVAQRRRRVFVVASARNGFDPAAILFESDGVRRDTAPRRQAGQDVTGTLSSRTSGGGGLGTDFDVAGGCQPVQSGVAFAIQAGALRVNPESGPSGMGVKSDVAYTLEARTEVQCVASAIAPTLRGDDASYAGPERREGGENVPVVVSSVKWPADVACTLNASFGSKQGLEDQHINGGASLFVPVIGSYRTAGDGAAYDSGDRTAALTTGTDPCANVIAFAENSRGELRLEGGDGQRTGTLSTGGGKPGQGTPSIVQGWQVRRLTPTECERLQGFPEVTKTVTIKLCSDHQNNSANAEIQSRKLPISASHADESDSRQIVNAAADPLSINRQECAQHAVLNARINLERGHLQLRNVGKLLLSANLAELANSFPLLTPIESIVRQLALTLNGPDQKTPDGKAVSLPFTMHSMRRPIGNVSARSYGSATETPVGDAATFTTAANDFIKSTMLQAGRNSPNYEQNFLTSCCFVTDAIVSCIPVQTSIENLSEIRLELVEGWTLVPHRNKPAADGPRYKSLGNSMAVPCMAWIGRRLLRYTTDDAVNTLSSRKL